MSYISMFENQVKSHGDEIAIVDREGKRSLTYEELDKLSSRVAAKLLDKGIMQGSFIPVLMGRQYEYIAAELGILREFFKNRE